MNYKINRYIKSHVYENLDSSFSVILKTVLYSNKVYIANMSFLRENKKFKFMTIYQIILETFNNKS